MCFLPLKRLIIHVLQLKKNTEEARQAEEARREVADRAAKKIMRTAVYTAAAQSEPLAIWFTTEIPLAKRRKITEARNPQNCLIGLQQ